MRVQGPSAKPATGDAFEDVLYGSESELDSDDEGPSAPAPKRKNIDHGARLRVDDDEPMDLLQGAASRITSTPPLYTTYTLLLTLRRFAIQPTP